MHKAALQKPTHQSQTSNHSVTVADCLLEFRDLNQAELHGSLQIRSKGFIHYLAIFQLASEAFFLPGETVEVFVPTLCADKDVAVVDSIFDQRLVDEEELSGEDTSQR